MGAAAYQGLTTKTGPWRCSQGAGHEWDYITSFLESWQEDVILWRPQHVFYTSDGMN
jgi:hypothetical protein